MKNTKAIALIAFTAIHFTSSAIYAQQLTNSSTKRGQQERQAKQSSHSSSNDRMKLSDDQSEGKKGRKSSGDSLREESQSNSDSDKMSLGGADAGGALTIRQNGRLLTLTEAGFIFTKSADEAVVQAKKYPVYYSFSQQTKEELRNILATLPIGNDPIINTDFIFKKIMVPEDRSIFIDARKSVEIGVYEKIKKDYQKVLKFASKKIVLTEVNSALPAYSDAEKTYILAAFEELTPRRQALTLIHEYLMRTSTRIDVKLLPILQIDNLIQAYLNSEKNEADAVAYTKAMVKIESSIADNGPTVTDAIYMAATKREKMYVAIRVGVLYDSSLLKKVEEKNRFAALKMVEQQIHRPILASELFLKPSELFDLPQQMDMSLAQKFDSILPFTTLFSDAEASIDTFKYRRTSYLESLTDKLRDKAHDRSEENKAKYANMALQLKKEFDGLCKSHIAEIEGSEVNGDGLIHTSSIVAGTYLIRCSKDAEIMGQGYKLEF
jgi:hypothetical protein